MPNYRSFCIGDTFTLRNDSIYLRVIIVYKWKNGKGVTVRDVRNKKRTFGVLNKGEKKCW